jgi:hypothetical protein
LVGLKHRTIELFYYQRVASWSNVFEQTVSISTVEARIVIQRCSLNKPFTAFIDFKPDFYIALNCNILYCLIVLSKYKALYLFVNQISSFGSQQKAHRCFSKSFIVIGILESIQFIVKKFWNLKSTHFKNRRITN